MNHRLRIFAAVVAALTLSTLGLAGCSKRPETLTISADATPHAEILKFIQSSDQLKKTKIKIEPISGQVDPNQLLEAGDVDANFFQHKPYLDDWQRQHNTTNLVTVASTHIEPMAVYSKDYASIATLPEEPRIAVPKDPTNFARALYVLQGAGLLTMKEPDPAKANLSTITLNDIATNPKQATFAELDRPQLPRTLDDPAIDAAVINSNYALEAGLNPTHDGLFVESHDNNPYANYLVTTKDKADTPAMKELAAALESEQTAAWMKVQYGDSIIPVHGK